METADALLEQVKIYNPVPVEEETAYHEMLTREYALFLQQQVVVA